MAQEKVNIQNWKESFSSMECMLLLPLENRNNVGYVKIIGEPSMTLAVYANELACSLRRFSSLR